MKVEGSVAKLSFDNAPNGLTSYSKPLSSFEVAGEDKVFHPAKAALTATGISVQSDKVKNPAAVRYAYKDWIVGELLM